MSKRDPRNGICRDPARAGKQDDKVLALSCDSAAVSGMTPFVQRFPPSAMWNAAYQRAERD
jgi:hypothetical protein